MDIKEEEILGSLVETHWYYQSKAQAVGQTLAATSFESILDVGAGSGFFSRYLLKRTDAKRALCVDIGYAQESEITEAGKPLQFRKAAGSASADLVLLMDVLEHVDQDEELLRTYVERASSGTWFLVSVPAFQFLWSDHDVFLGHYRRYRLSQLEALVRRSGLTVDRGFYYFGAVFPMAAALRLMQRLKSFFSSSGPRSQLKPHSALTNRILLTISEMEIPIMRANRLFGLTAFCLARKP